MSWKETDTITRLVYAYTFLQGMVQNNLYQVEETSAGLDDASESDQIVASNESQGDERLERTSVFRYKEGEEKEYISKTAGYLCFYGANVAVQKVAQHIPVDAVHLMRS